MEGKQGLTMGDRWLTDDNADRPPLPRKNQEYACRDRGRGEGPAVLLEPIPSNVVAVSAKPCPDVKVRETTCGTVQGLDFPFTSISSKYAKN